MNPFFSLNLLGRFSIDAISIILLMVLVYVPIYKKKESFFTFFVFNLVIFLITYSLNRVEISIGAAFGLFAVFSMLRYRTSDISMKDMTYLFLMIALGLINAVHNGTFTELVLLNLAVLLLTYILESNLFFRSELNVQLTYNRLDLLIPAKKDELIEDLSQIIGYKVSRVRVLKQDIIKKTANLIVYYFDEPVEVKPRSNQLKFPF